jgi:hypothetical protein
MYKVLNPLGSTQAFTMDIQYPQIDSDVYFMDRHYRQQYQNPPPVLLFWPPVS